MTRIVIDTHVWVWAAYEREKLSAAAVETLRNADDILVSTVSIYEIGQKVRIDRWPGMTDNRLTALVDAEPQPVELADLTTPIARRAALLDWSHKDPFDRIIAATALELNCSLVSKDPAFRSCSGIEPLW